MAKRTAEVFKDRGGLWRWRLIAATGGKEIARSEEGYVRRGYAARRAGELNPTAKVVILDA